MVIAVLVSAFSIFAYNIGYGAGQGGVTVAGEKETIDPAGAPPVTVAEGVVVGPAGLAIPVVGVKPEPAGRHLHPGPCRRRPCP